MTVFVACFVTALAVLVLRTPLLHAPAVFYVLAVLISITSTLHLIEETTGAFFAPLEYVITHGSVAFVLFAIIMYMGVLPETSCLRHYLMPIRGRLSIFASLIAVGHFAGYLLAFVMGFLFRGNPVAPRAFAAFGFAFVLFVILLPLAVTSVTTVREKMSAANWKRLQQWAYMFFVLLYIHIAVMLGPSVFRGGDAAVRFACYTAVFVPYVVLFFVRGKWSNLKPSVSS